MKNKTTAEEQVIDKLGKLYSGLRTKMASNIVSIRQTNVHYINILHMLEQLE